MHCSTTNASPPLKGWKIRNERRKEWQAYQKQLKEAKYREWAEHKARRQAEYEAQKKAYEEEEAKRDPWEEEKAICEQLILFVEKYLPKKEVRMPVAAAYLTHAYAERCPRSHDAGRDDTLLVHDGLTVCVRVMDWCRSNRSMASSAQPCRRKKASRRMTIRTRAS